MAPLGQNIDQAPASIVPMVIASRCIGPSESTVLERTGLRQETIRLIGDRCRWHRDPDRVRTFPEDVREIVLSSVDLKGTSGPCTGCRRGVSGLAKVAQMSHAVTTSAATMDHMEGIVLKVMAQGEAKSFVRGRIVANPNTADRSVAVLIVLKVLLVVDGLKVGIVPPESLAVAILEIRHSDSHRQIWS